MKVMPRSIGATLLCVLAACTSSPRTPTATSSSPSPSATSTPTTPVPTKSYVPPSLPADFVVVDTTWVSDDIGWVLGSRGCAAPSCVTILRTNDGGAHWIKLSAPSCPPASCISRIRFATTSIGYAFGSSLFMTTDGGRSWRRQAPIVLVDSLEISSGLAFRVAYAHGGCPGPCDARVESSRLGSNVWRRVYGPTQGVAFGLQVQGSRIYFAQFGNPASGAGTAQTSFARSLDQGKTWSTFGDPCKPPPRGENDGIQFAAAPGGTLVVLCQPRSGGVAFVVKSEDSGTTFHRLAAVPLRQSLAAFMIGAGSARVIAVAFEEGGSEGVAVSRDGGSTWKISRLTEIQNGDVIGFVGFEDARTARAAFGSAYIWTTRDEGRTWRRSAPFAT